MQSHLFFLYFLPLMSFPPLWIPFPFIFVPLSSGVGGWGRVIDLSLHLTIFFGSTGPDRLEGETRRPSLKMADTQHVCVCV